MTKEELEHWAATNGMTLITTAAFTALVRGAATVIAGVTDSTMNSATCSDRGSDACPARLWPRQRAGRVAGRLPTASPTAPARRPVTAPHSRYLTGDVRQHTSTSDTRGVKMPTQTRRKQAKTSARGLGWRHQQAVETLRRKHRDGSACDWCGRPLWLDRPATGITTRMVHRVSGTLTRPQRHHRAEAIRLGKPIPLPDRLLHQTCNIQRGDGGHDHLAPTNTDDIDTSRLAMPWPW